jgi:DNA-binding NarL/FixJ family response regulator
VPASASEAEELTVGTTGAAGPVVLFVDDRPLRRAALARLLKDWAEETGLAIAVAAASPPEPPEPAGPPGAVRLVLLSAGGALAEAPEALRAIEGFARRLPAAVVVLSDRGGPADVVAALGAGARGVVAADTDPAVVLGVLRFVLDGGTFFPP